MSQTSTIVVKPGDEEDNEPNEKAGPTTSDPNAINSELSDAFKEITLKATEQQTTKLKTEGTLQTTDSSTSSSKLDGTTPPSDEKEEKFDKGEAFKLVNDYATEACYFRGIMLPSPPESWDGRLFIFTAASDMSTTENAFLQNENEFVQSLKNLESVLTSVDPKLILRTAVLTDTFPWVKVDVDLQRGNSLSEDDVKHSKEWLDFLLTTLKPKQVFVGCSHGTRIVLSVLKWNGFDVVQKKHVASNYAKYSYIPTSEKFFQLLASEQTYPFDLFLCAHPNTSKVLHLWKDAARCKCTPLTPDAVYIKSKK